MVEPTISCCMSAEALSVEGSDVVVSYRMVLWSVVVVIASHTLLSPLKVMRAVKFWVAQATEIIIAAVTTRSVANTVWFCFDMILNLLESREAC